MKKRYLLFFCCLLLLCMTLAGCGKQNDDPDSSNSSTSANLAISTLSSYVEKVSDAYKTSAAAPLSDGLGMEGTLKVSLNPSISQILGLDGLESASLTFSVNSKDAFSLDGTLFLNEDRVLSLNALLQKTMLYFNLPDYSAVCAAYDLSDSMDVSETPASVPDAKALEALWNRYSSRFLSLLEPVKGDNSVSVGLMPELLGEGYSFRAKLHSASAPIAGLTQLLSDLADDLAPYYDTSSYDISLTDDTEASLLYVNYYEGKNGQYAWEITTDAANTSSVFFLNAESGLCLYLLDADNTADLFLSTTRKTATSGTIVLYDEEEDQYIDYENFSKDGCDLSFETEELTGDIRIRKNGDATSVSFSLLASGISLSGTMEGKASGDVSLTLSIGSILGADTAKISLDVSRREYQPISLPASSVDPDTWVAELDYLALTDDALALAGRYPFLYDMILSLLGGN